jgi:CRP-like cAMP-binding protein
MTKPENLRIACLFANLDDDPLAKVSARGERRDVSQGEVIFKEGSAGDDIFLLLEGRVQCTVAMAHKSEQAPVHTVVAGDIFGEFSLIAEHPRSATAVAIQDSVYFTLTRKAFRDLADQNPRLGYVVLRDLGEILIDRIIKTTQELRASLLF